MVGEESQEIGNEGVLHHDQCRVQSAPNLVKGKLASHTTGTLKTCTYIDVMTCVIGLSCWDRQVLGLTRSEEGPERRWNVFCYRCVRACAWEFWVCVYSILSA